MTKLITTFPNLSLLIENSIHGPHGTDIGPLIEQCGVDGPGRPIDKAIGVENLQDLLSLFVGESPGRNVRLRFMDFRLQGDGPPVVAGPRNPQRFTGGPYPNLYGERCCGCHGLFPPFGSGDP